jgi:hypothetical protein
MLYAWIERSEPTESHARLLAILSPCDADLQTICQLVRDGSRHSQTRLATRGLRLKIHPYTTRKRLWDLHDRAREDPHGPNPRDLEDKWIN